MLSGRAFRLCIGCLSFFYLMPVAVLGQVTTASVVGTVTDQSGAVIPGVEVVALHVETGVSRSIITNETGGYALRNLPIGRYTISAELPGFKKAEVSQITLLIDQTARIDLVMEAGEISETVTVEGSQIPLLNKDTSDVGEVITNHRIVELPLNAREFLTLARLTPGVTPPIPGSLAMLTGEWSALNASGLRAEYQMVTLHGMINIEPQNNALGVRPSVDAIQEFKIQTSNFSAELPSKGGAVVNIAIKSGTNQFHGSLFEFNRNSAYSARSFFETKNRPILNQNQFGGTVGGPILKERTFFFVAYEGRRILRPQAQLGRVPTPDQRRGIFDPAQFGIIHDPTTWDPATLKRQPFPDNTIPANRISAVSRKVLDYVSLPNRPGPSNIHKTFRFQDNLDIWNIRVDHHLGQNDTLMFNYNRNDHERVEPGDLPPLLFAGFGEGVGGWLSLIDRLHANAAYTRIFSPALTNEFRLGVVQNNSGRWGRNLGTNFGRDLLGIPGSEARDQFTDFPRFNLTGYTLPAENVAAIRVQSVYQAGDHLTWVKGAHSFKFGADFFQNLTFDLTCNCAGVYTFSGQYVSPGRAAKDGDAFAQFLLGTPNAMERVEVRDRNYFHGKAFGLYLQDDWRLTRRLTVNAGIRYDYAYPMREKNGHLASWDAVTGQVVYPQGAKLEDCDPTSLQCKPFVPSFPFRFHDQENLYETDKQNWGPRLGFAYELTPRTVFRMAYGIFSNPHLLTRYEVLSGFNVPWQFTPRIITNPDVPNASLDQGFTGPSFVKARSAIIRMPRLMKGFRNSNAQMWNMGLQLALAKDYMLDLAYVGTKGSHATGQIDMNLPAPGPGVVDQRRPFPAIGRVIVYISGLNSHYHSLQAKLTKRFSKGLGINVAYTMSKSIDNSSADVGTTTEAGDVIENPFRIRESTRGLSGFDLPHRFVFNYIWDLPGLDSGALRHVASGWQMTGVWSLQSGWPFTVVAPTRTNNGTGSRPNRTCEGSLANPTVAKWFDTGCFVVPDIFTYGNAGRNILRTDGLVNFDVGVFKNWAFAPLGEEGRFQFRAEFFNLFNHPNFGPPLRNIGASTVGQVTTVATGREIQFGLKLLF